MYVQTNIYMHAITINEKRDHEFEGIGEGYMEGFGARKGREKCCN